MLRFNVYQDAAKEWRWRLAAQNGRIIADSGEGYASEYNAVRAAQRTREIASSAPILNHAGTPYTSVSKSLTGGADPF